MTRRSFNGWIVLDKYPATYFTAPTGKRVYCNSPEVATVFEYLARRWHEEIEPIAQSSPDNWYKPRERYVKDKNGKYDLIGIHSWRERGTKVGTGDKSNHRSATGMDINGHLHPYEATMSGPWYSGFSSAQKAKMREIIGSVRDAKGRKIIRWGYDFAPGLRDAMHLEIAPGVSRTQVQEAAVIVKALMGVDDLMRYHEMLICLGFTADQAGVRNYQSAARGLKVDGILGPMTAASLEDDMRSLEELHAKVDDLMALLKKTPQYTWGYRHPKYEGRDAHGLLRDASTARDLK